MQLEAVAQAVSLGIMIIDRRLLLESIQDEAAFGGIQREGLGNMR